MRLLDFCRDYAEAVEEAEEERKRMEKKYPQPKQTRGHRGNGKWRKT